MNKHCKYCNKSFNGITEYQCNEKIKRHISDKHEMKMNTIPIFLINSIPMSRVSTVFKDMRIRQEGI